MTRSPQADFGEWLRSNPAPDLQGLVAQFGSYGAITREAWIEYEIAMTIWQARYRERHKEAGDGKFR
jgi:hypothetical protein